MKPHPMLFPLSLIYGFGVTMRNLFFDIGLLRTVDVGVPVISIGNITAGGTGKSPVVVNAALILMESGKNVAVISRGYGRKTKGTVIVCNGKNILADANAAGDEPLMIAQNLKTAIVIVDEDRVRGAKKAIGDFGAEVILLDDGFQHRSIKRSKDIVLIDADQLPFDTMLLPAGYRRELTGSVKRADAVLVTKSKSPAEAERTMSRVRNNSIQRIFSSSFQPSGIRHLFGGVGQSLEILKGHTAVALCGIAKPVDFRRSLESCGITIKEFFNFPDHHAFTMSEIRSVIESYNRHKVDYIITTEKDAVRLSGFQNVLNMLPVSALLMDVTIHQGDEWKKYLVS